jgi:hypothetical protein
MGDDVGRAGLRSLVFELDNLRCELAQADWGEKMLEPQTRARMEQRVAELQTLLNEDDVVAILSEGDE